MTQEITYVQMRLPWAPTINTAWKHAHNRTYLSKQYQTFLKEVALLNIRPVDWDSCGVKLTLFPPDYRRIDIDNRVKTTLDALTRVGFWKDDSIVSELHVVRGAPVYNPCIYVEAVKLDSTILVSGEEFSEISKRKKK